MSIEQKPCPKCKQLNATNKIACDFCGARLPWAKTAVPVPKPQMGALQSPLNTAPATKSMHPLLGAALLGSPFLLWGIGHALFSSSPVTPAQPVFDVPAFAGLDIHGVEQRLGTPNKTNPPSAFVQGNMKSGIIPSTWDEDWDKGGYNLDVEYDYFSGKVNNYFISTSGNVEDLILLQEASNTASGSGFTLENVGHDGKYTGIKITLPR